MKQPFNYRDAVLFSTNVEAETTTTTTTTTTFEDTNAVASLITPVDGIDDESSATSSSSLISVSMPELKYTVPGMKIGWKDTDTGLWMDDDGPRNGPPQNYWRQQSDEKLYKDSMDLIQNILQQDEDFFMDNDMMVNELVRPFERKNSIRRPFLSRSILSNWVPIVHRGGDRKTTTKIVASIIADDKNNDGSNNSRIDVPYRLYVQRTAGRKLGPVTPYGQLDEHLEPDEEITIEVQQQHHRQRINNNNNDDDDDDSNNIVVSSIVSDPVPVSADNISMAVNNNNKNNDNNNDDNAVLFSMGGITYVSKYIMIMRHKNDHDDTNFKKSSSVTEIWMKIDG